MEPTSVTIRGLWTWSFTLLFVALKLTDQINWNWLLVLAPLITSIVVSQLLGLFIAYKTSKHNHVEVEPQQETHSSTGMYV